MKKCEWTNFENLFMAPFLGYASVLHIFTSADLSPPIHLLRIRLLQVSLLDLSRLKDFNIRPVIPREHPPPTPPIHPPYKRGQKLSEVSRRYPLIKVWDQSMLSSLRVVFTSKNQIQAHHRYTHIHWKHWFPWEGTTTKTEIFPLAVVFFWNLPYATWLSA